MNGTQEMRVKQKEINSGLSKELSFERARLSETIPSLVAYIEKHQPQDALANGFAKTKNPWKDKVTCDII